MKKLGIMLLSAVLAFAACFTFLGCSEQEKDILVVCREAASGTREAFDKYVGLSGRRNNFLCGRIQQYRKRA